MQSTISAMGHNSPPTDIEILQSALCERHEKLLSGAQKLIEAGGRLPGTIEDDETAGKAGDFIKLVTGCVKNLEAERVNEKEPYLHLGRAVDGFFKSIIDALTATKNKAARPLDAHLKNKAAEEQRKRMEEARRAKELADQEAAAAQALLRANMKPEAEKMLDQAVITEQVAAKAEIAAQAKPADLAQSRGTSGSLASLRTRWVGEVTDIAALDLERLRHHINPEALQKAVNSFVNAGGRDLRGAHIFEKSETVVR